MLISNFFVLVFYSPWNQQCVVSNGCRKMPRGWCDSECVIMLPSVLPCFVTPFHTIELLGFTTSVLAEGAIKEAVAISNRSSSSSKTQMHHCSIAAFFGRFASRIEIQWQCDSRWLKNKCPWPLQSCATSHWEYAKDYVDWGETWQISMGIESKVLQYNRKQRKSYFK